MDYYRELPLDHVADEASVPVNDVVSALSRTPRGEAVAPVAGSVSWGGESALAALPSADRELGRAFLVESESSGAAVACPEPAAVAGGLRDDVLDVPTDISAVRVIGGGPDEGVLSVVVSRAPQLVFGYMTLIFSVVAASGMGTAYAAQHVGTMLKMVWRGEATLAFCSPAFAVLAWRRGRASRRSLPDRRDIALLVSCSTAFALYNGTFVFALGTTSIAHAYLLNNLHGPIIVLAKWLQRRPVSCAELFGAAVALLGATLCATDARGRSAELNPPSVKGDVVAAVGALSGAAYLLTCSASRASGYNLWVMMLFIHGVGLPLNAFAASVLDPHGVSLSRPLDSHAGALGWLSSARELRHEVWIAGVCTFGGSAGYIAALKYVSPLVLSCCLLLEPAVGTAIGVLFGYTDLPTWRTDVGALVTAAGTAVLIIAGARRVAETTVEARLGEQESMRPPA